MTKQFIRLMFTCLVDICSWYTCWYTSFKPFKYTDNDNLL